MTTENKTPKDEATQEAAPVHKSLASALARAQSEMGKALKSANNPHFKSKYADLASVADACMPSLTKHGIAVIQPTFDDDTGRYVKTILIHGESGETLECRVPLIVQKQDMQGYGSAVTYARRYGLMGMAGIAPDDDDGFAAAQAAPKRERTPDGPKFDSAAAKSRIVSAINNQSTKDGLLSLWNAEGDALKAMTDADYEDAKAARDAKGISFNTPKTPDSENPYHPAGPDVGDGHQGDGGY